MKLIALLLLLIASPALGAGNWYYCDPAQAYYPHVANCSSPWREVPSSTDSTPPEKTPPPPIGGIVCQTDEGSDQKLEVLLPAQCDARIAKFRTEEAARTRKEEQEAAARDAAARAQRDEEARHREEAVIRQAQQDIAAGYRKITFDDFALDGKDFSSTEQKVIVSGLYIRMGQSDYLAQSILALGMAREYGKLDQVIGLLIDDSPREVRRAFLNCRNNMIAAQAGCTATSVGRVVSCMRTTLVGSSTLPCIAVDDIRGSS
jgi:hypothetical protein